jgi:hypothetical protein
VDELVSSSRTPSNEAIDSVKRGCSSSLDRAAISHGSPSRRRDAHTLFAALWKCVRCLSPDYPAFAWDVITSSGPDRIALSGGREWALEMRDPEQAVAFRRGELPVRRTGQIRWIWPIYVSTASIRKINGSASLRGRIWRKSGCVAVVQVSPEQMRICMHHFASRKRQSAFEQAISCANSVSYRGASRNL